MLRLFVGYFFFDIGRLLKTPEWYCFFVLLYSTVLGRNCKLLNILSHHKILVALVYLTTLSKQSKRQVFSAKPYFPFLFYSQIMIIYFLNIFILLKFLFSMCMLPVKFTCSGPMREWPLNKNFLPILDKLS